MPDVQRPSSKPLSAEDEKRPVVGFLRMAGWSDEKIALVVAAHKRGEVFTVSVKLS
jgi:hypothetical protein